MFNNNGILPLQLLTVVLITAVYFTYSSQTHRWLYRLLITLLLAFTLIVAHVSQGIAYAVWSLLLLMVIPMTFTPIVLLLNRFCMKTRHPESLPLHWWEGYKVL